jgi:uncharacterized membrane protein YeiH
MNLVQIIGYIGVFVFAITGALKARTFKMDVFGAAVMAFATAYGGGTVRDILLGRTPVNWINDYLALALVVGGVALVSFLNFNSKRFKRFIFITDAIGIGLFTSAGIDIAIRYGANNVYAIILGVISATFGGLIADIISNEIPSLLKRGELYATACLLGGICYVALEYTAASNNTQLIAAVLIVVTIRIVSKYKRLTLPEA